jgi:hypothetical protein
MSVYSTLKLRRKDIIRLIGSELNVDSEYPDGREKTENELLEDILYSITSRNPHSPYHDNNYFVIPDDYVPKDEYDKIYYYTR